MRGSDLLWSGGELSWLRTPPVQTPHSHGSGCTLSAAITAHLARGLALRQAIMAAKRFVQEGLGWSLAIGSGQGPLCHWHGLMAQENGSGTGLKGPAQR